MAHLADLLSKGSKVLVSGSLKQDSWEAESGEKRSRILLTAYKVEFLSPKAETGSQSVATSAHRPQGRSARLAGGRTAAA